MTTPLIDPTTFSELQDAAGADFVVELVAAFLEEAPQILRELRAAYETGSVEPFRRAAHSIKSNSLTFGATTLAAMARELETGGLPADRAPIDALERAYDAVAVALKALYHD
jgi:HPt (histidine-containing phosphotransfer) domain-containing protein